MIQAATDDERGASAPFSAERAMLEAKELEHRLEIGKLKMQLALYRQALVEAGIEPPDRDGDELLEMWRDCSAVISSASEFVMHLRSSRELLGTFK